MLMYKVTLGLKQYFFYKGQMFTLIATKIQSSNIFGDMDNYLSLGFNQYNDQNSITKEKKRKIHIMKVW